jgi:hypothetical protein
MGSPCRLQQGQQLAGGPVQLGIKKLDRDIQNGIDQAT